MRTPVGMVLAVCVFAAARVLGANGGEAASGGGADPVVPTLARALDAARSCRGIELALVRTYPSSPRLRGRTGAFGKGWIDNLTCRFERSGPERLELRLPSGEIRAFADVKGKWRPASPYDSATMEETTGAYVLAEGNGLTRTFDKESGHILFVRDGMGNALVFSWSGGRLLRVAHTDGQSLSFGYESGLVSSVTDDCGRRTEYAYDDGCLVFVKMPDGLAVRYEYGAAGSPAEDSLVRILKPDGSAQGFEYGGDGRVCALLDGGARRTEIGRGGDGTVAVVSPGGGRAVFSFGADGEWLGTTDALGHATRCEYSQGLSAAVISPSGRKVSFARDGKGRIAELVAASGARSVFGYEGRSGDLAAVTDANGQTVAFSRDGKGRCTAATFPDGTVATAVYNERGDVVRTANRRGQSIEREYDAQGRLVRQTWPDGRVFTYAYDAHGNLVLADDTETGAIRMAYDQGDRMTRIDYPRNRGFRFEYDTAGRLAVRTSHDGHAERFAYDGEGRLASMTKPDGAPYLTYRYDTETGLLAGQTYGNGASVAFRYDLAGRVAAIAHKDAGGAELERFAYAYDADGTCQAMLSGAGWETYAHDADGQLTAVFYPDGTKETFAYDPAGNRTAADGTAYRVNALNQYTAIGEGEGAALLVWDLDGNLSMTSAGESVTTYFYDALNRLVGVTNEALGIRWSCRYDALGDRVSVTDNGVTTERLCLPGVLPSVAAEYVDGKLAARNIVAGAVQIARMDAETADGRPKEAIRYFHGDLLGSVRLATDAEGGGCGRCDYTVFGGLRGEGSLGSAPSAGYVGMLGVETDPTGLLFMRNRYYSPALGRFLSPDPIGFAGGDANLYRYCGNAPVLRADPDGCGFLDLAAKGWAKLGAAALVGAVTVAAGAGLAYVGVGGLAAAISAGGAALLTGGSLAGLGSAVASSLGYIGLGGGLAATGGYGIYKTVADLPQESERTSGVDGGYDWNAEAEPVPIGFDGAGPDAEPWPEAAATDRREAAEKGAGNGGPQMQGEGNGPRRPTRKQGTDAKPPPESSRAPQNPADGGGGGQTEKVGELPPREIPDPDNDSYVWCEDVCREVYGRRPKLPRRDTADTVYLVCENCGNVVRKQARKAKRMERLWARKGKATHWFGDAFRIRQAQSVDQGEE